VPRGYNHTDGRLGSTGPFTAGGHHALGLSLLSFSPRSVVCLGLARRGQSSQFHNTRNKWFVHERPSISGADGALLRLLSLLPDAGN